MSSLNFSNHKKKPYFSSATETRDKNKNHNTQGKKGMLETSESIREWRFQWE
jgi:hypothetical protein